MTTSSSSLTCVVAIGWLLTICGLLYANWTANCRETRKEYRADLESLGATVDNLLEAYRKYCTCTEDDDQEQARLSVHSAMERLRRRVERLENRIGTDFKNRFVALYEVVTGGDFESKSRKKSKIVTENYARATAAAEALLACAEKWFEGLYQT
jgi:ElaB/YqjD/DUF883 family membrane-anchored ribosome-binding protein